MADTPESLGEISRRLTRAEKTTERLRDTAIDRDTLDERTETILGSIALVSAKVDPLAGAVAEIKEDQRWTRRLILGQIVTVIGGLVLLYLTKAI